MDLLSCLTTYNKAVGRASFAASTISEVQLTHLWPIGCLGLTLWVEGMTDVLIR